MRALDDAGVAVQHMELNAPSLDDVFAEATGHRLEGADEATKQPADEETDMAPRRGRRRR